MATSSIKAEKAIKTINARGILLVFPINNKSEPKSLWSEFYPRTKMRWEWDESSDNRVGNMWQLMKRLSDSRHVVYSKWYQGRSTFFSLELFRAILCLFQKQIEMSETVSRPAKELLDILESDSPLSTKQLKKMADLQGKANESTYQKAMKQLFTRFQVVAFGEVDDGAFPSLAVGATKHLYEDLWTEAKMLDAKAAQKVVDQYLPPGSAVRKFFDKNITRD